MIGCAAGFLNVPKIKGTHTSMKSGIYPIALAEYINSCFDVCAFGITDVYVNNACHPGHIFSHVLTKLVCVSFRKVLSTT